MEFPQVATSTDRTIHLGLACWGENFFVKIKMCKFIISCLAVLDQQFITKSPQNVSLFGNGRFCASCIKYFLWYIVVQFHRQILLLGEIERQLFQVTNGNSNVIWIDVGLDAITIHKWM